MISVNFRGGLANRMFMYAFSRSLVARGKEVTIDNHNFKPRERMTYEAVNISDAFPNIEIKYTSPHKYRFSLVSGRKGKLLRGLSRFIIGEKYYFEPEFKYCPEVYDQIKENSNIIGFWQTEKYFADIKEDIFRQFEFIPFSEEKNMTCRDHMLAENSVAIHVRKGMDYLRDSLWDDTCPADYYRKAIDYIKSHVENPKFYLFTDNLEWVKSNISGTDFTVIDWNPTKGKFNFRDMQLMTYAKHIIISNSSYSWWAAWLNKNKSNIVIAPKQWFSPQVKEYLNNDIVCDNWVKL